MSKYGIPYMGSKNQIAEEIIDFLPSGNRFIGYMLKWRYL